MYLNTPSNEKRKQKTNICLHNPDGSMKGGVFFNSNITDMLNFSFFKKGIHNTIPEKNITLKEVHNYIISDAAKEATERLESKIITQMGRG